MQTSLNSVRSWIEQDKNNKYIAISGVVLSCYILRQIYWFVYRRYHALPPGPNGLPFIGMFLTWNRSSTARIRLAKKYGPILYSTYLGFPCIVISSSKILKQIMQQKEFLNRPTFIDANTDFTHSIWSHGASQALHFMVLNGQQWKKRRKLAQDTLLKVLNNETLSFVLNEAMTNEIQPELDEIVQSNGIWYPRKAITYIAFNTYVSTVPRHTPWTYVAISAFLLLCRIYATLFGGNSIGRESRLFQEMAEDVTSTANLTILLEDALAIKLPFFKHIFGAKLDRVRNRRDANILRLIQQRTTAQHDSKSYINYTHEMVRNGELSQDQEVADTFLMFGAGTEATSSSLDFAITLIAKNEHVQSLVRLELQQIMQDGQFHLKLIHHCPRFRALVHELLRISTSVFGGVHHTTLQDHWITLENGNRYKIPKHALIFSNLDYIQVHGGDEEEEHWEQIDKDRIVLENFLCSDDDGEVRFVMNASWMPFGVGQRQCLGRTLAMKEIEFTLGYLLMNYRFRLVEHVRNVVRLRKNNMFTIIQQPAPGVLVEHA